jgi:HAD superfamily hydrolase (TIGR01509 family)
MMNSVVALFYAVILAIPFVVEAFSPFVSYQRLARRGALVARPQTVRAAAAEEKDFALLFDCDGVILETEEFHRLAYNAAFKAANVSIDGVPVEWSVEYYDVLQNTVGGGKPKMFFHFRNTTKAFPNFGDGNPAPVTQEEQQALIDALQDDKTSRFKQLVEKAECRPGVLQLMDEAIADSRIAVGVCSASTKAAAQRTLDVTLGQERIAQLDCCILGDDVSEKKPHPMIYNEARKRLGISANRCVVIEDSLVGLRAAKAAVS